MYQVTKRDGQVVDFEISKISDAITKAFVAIEKQYHPTIIDLIALHVTSDFEPKIRDGVIAVDLPVLSKVPGAGFEPASPYGHMVLSHVCIPFPCTRACVKVQEEGLEPSKPRF